MAMHGSVEVGSCDVDVMDIPKALLSMVRVPTSHGGGVITLDDSAVADVVAGMTTSTSMEAFFSFDSNGSGI
ncbi:unnamed protein product [Linum trigynum]|uniref:EF-hand domain-containing protein n=1 Tax=Linum trigynum TaxID=586398 RepID=A0AAV2FG96_9ROSI